MRTLLIGVAAAGFVAVVTSANAQQSSTTQGSSATPAPSSQSSASQTPSSQSPSSTATPSSQTGTTASASKDLASKELSGVVKKIDKDKRSLKLSSSAGVEQDVKLAPSATITRDGAQAGLDQLKEGDEVRASFDPSTNQATKVEVQSKQTDKDKAKSDMKGDMKSDTKTETKGK